MATSLVKGSIVALVTPFNADGSVNYDKLGELIDFHVENKTDGIHRTPDGGTGRRTAAQKARSPERGNTVVGRRNRSYGQRGERRYICRVNWVPVT